ncbi:protein kinase family protein / protein phosphatase 2C family protein [Perilla frutescens var. hirtella]|uniref:Protein kinase and PP2C-like domain-containing protein n=1 Tax=Perilla frutescens var. hirtella TaxID=608512 RepID=A0AAD4PA99_PERFH|nr:protein kinase family protein / protein phosphatase 2C family protein [Perilla frutescens var. hirtella]
MVLEIMEPNTCFRGCCHSQTIPLHLPPSSYSLSSPIARGGESVVYEAVLHGKKVAAKKPVLSTSDDLNKFHKELQLLSKLDHPGIMKLVAAHARPPNYMFFFELYEAGALSQKLHVEEYSPSIGQVMEITARLAKALLYLHSLGIVHRDVKPANILLNENLQPHLADFGLAEYMKDLKQVSVENWKSSGKPTGGFHKKNMVGTLIYMAPEVLRKEIHTEKSDVYSFGVTVNELLTGVVPYTDLRAEAQAHTVLEMNYTEQQLTAAVVSEGLRPVLAGPESGASSSLLSLIQRCWDADPQNRPPFSEIVLELDAMLRSEKRTDEKADTFADSVISRDHVDTTNIPSYQEPLSWISQGQDIQKSGYLSPENIAPTWLSLDDVTVYCPVLSWGSFSTCGRRETMEDTHFMIPHFFNENGIHLFGILDGHRGAAAAEFSAGALPGYLRTLVSVSSPSQALLEAFVKTDVAFRNELNYRRQSKGLIQKDSHPGCTAITALIVKNKLFVANAGDCRTIICRAGNPYALSRDHVASCLEERERVVGAGGQVKWQVDTWRIGPAALQVTRSIGDDDLKPFVTAEPEITETSLSSEDEYIVMASDGLWDVISNADVVSIIKDTVKEPGMCSKRLATEAAERGSKDNITVIVVFLRPVSTAERIY